MLKRRNQILAGILIVQIVLSAVVFWPKSAATGASEPLFSDVQAEDIVALTILDADGNSIALRRVMGDWVLPDADDYPADADKITEVLDKIVGLTSSRLVTRTDASHKRLKVATDDFERRVEVETQAGTEYCLYLGSSPSYGATHFRLDGQSETYLTGDISTWEANAKAPAWIDTAYVSVPQEEIARLTLENQSGTFNFAKDDQGAWTLAELAAGDILDQTKVDALARRVASVNMVAPLGKTESDAYGMGAPSAVVTLEAGDRTVTLRVGTKDPSDNSYVVISSESPYYVRVAEYSVGDLVEESYDDFLQVSPTPTPQ